jgi:prepilin-type N-terminal cleavage/methylation domain-containing protein/prepilin-type processing-associated H-X9-DG protein
LHTFRTGFTLIELMVVVAIIVILIGILLPVLVSAKNKAYITQCSSGLRQLQIAMLEYSTDYDGRLPLMLVTNTADGIPARWVNAIYPYCQSKLIFACPNNPVFADPASRPEPLARMPETSYYYNGNALGGVLETRIGDQASVISLMDGWFFENGGGPGGLNYPMYYSPWANTQALADWVNGVSGTYVGPVQLGRMHLHNGGLNAAFVDSHVKWIDSAVAAQFSVGK